jgi:hypothetical protein
LRWWKINWDFAVEKAQCQSGLEMIVKDHTGSVIAAKSLSRSGILDPTVGEALASLHAVRLGQELGGSAIILEGDAKQVVEAINSDVSNVSRFGHLVEDIRLTLKSFPRWRCVFANRNANVAAQQDNLARGATRFIIDRDWKGVTRIVSVDGKIFSASRLIYESHNCFKKLKNCSKMVQLFFPKNCEKFVGENILILQLLL